MNGIPYFHEDYNISPSKAGKMLMGVARIHAKGKSKGKMTGKPKMGTTGGKVGMGKK